MNKIPVTIRSCLSDYTEYIRDQFTSDLIVGIYLYGSISLNGFDAEKSDIDFIVVLSRDLTQEESNNLKFIHKELSLNSLGKRMDGIYIPMNGVGKSNEELPPYFYCSSGKIKTGYWDINAITWWMVEHYGIKIYGKEIAELNFQTNWKKIIENMEYNINTYWINKAKNRFIFMFNDMVEFCILTLSRIVSTLEAEKIFTKIEGVRKAEEILPQRWHLLLKEGLRLRNNPRTTSFYPARWKRAMECRKLISFTHDLCNRKYFNNV
ncbi:DUF4111 domain-containing protein [Priestia filamentosa]|uniref:nucleotidyltransferase domain-containing protein n=1 Tax=Priestia filamentosa TaxID=1402861 RepID=UPI0039829EFB